MLAFRFLVIFLLYPLLSFASPLEDELLNDPLIIGYSVLTDQQVADSMNAETRSRNRASMTGREVANEVVNSEYDALTDAQKAQFLALIASEDLDPFGLGANVVKDIFGTGSTTVADLATARVESISRAVELGIPTVKPGHVEDARP